jgi:hypothetical protein
MTFISIKTTTTRSRFRILDSVITVISTITILGSFIPATAFGQGYIEGANISYEYLPMKVKSHHGDQKFIGNNFKAGTTIPVFITPNKSKYLLVGANFEAFDFSGTHPAFDVDRVYSVSPTLGFSTMIGKKFNLTALFMPALNSDFKDVKSADIKFGAVVRGSWKVSDKLTWKAILGYREQFYGPQYIVLVGMDWKINNKWQLFGDIPHSATLNYSVNQKVNTGFNLFVQASTYSLSKQNRYFEYNTVNPGLFAEYYVSPAWAVRATAAYTLIRNMEIYNRDEKTDGFIDFYEMGNRKDPINAEVSSGLSLKLSLSFRVFPGKH